MTAAAPSISYVSGHMVLGAEIDDGTGAEFVFHLPDALGSTRDVVDSLGNVIRSFEHDEYGNLISSSGSGAATPKTWIGGLSVNDDTADSGLWNMGHRNYAGGVLGRFISRDPIGHAGNLNLYAYPTNPVSFVDPSGLDRCKISDSSLEDAINSLRRDSIYGKMIQALENTPPGKKYFLGYGPEDAMYSEAITGNPREPNFPIATYINPKMKGAPQKVLELLVAHEVFHAWYAKTVTNGKCENPTLLGEILAESNAQNFFLRIGGTRQMLLDFEKQYPDFKGYVDAFDLTTSGANPEQWFKFAEEHWNNEERVNGRKKKNRLPKW